MEATGMGVELHIKNATGDFEPICLTDATFDEGGQVTTWRTLCDQGYSKSFKTGFEPTLEAVYKFDDESEAQKTIAGTRFKLGKDAILECKLVDVTEGVNLEFEAIVETHSKQYLVDDVIEVSNTFKINGEITETPILP